jgi:putative hydroxymethylpyrimidine transport system substrate-binding protein
VVVVGTRAPALEAGMRRLLAAAFVLAGLIAATTGCGGSGGGSGGQPFDLTLDFYVNPDHAGVYEALGKGYFADEGLDVRPTVPSDPAAPIKQVAAGRADLAISYEPEVMLARAQGLDVVAVAALVHGPLTSLISLPDAGISSPADLAGKTVVTAGIPYQAAYLDTILRNAGVDPSSVEQVDVGLNLLQPVISGRADAMLGGFLNVEGVDLAERGLDTRDVPVDQLRIPSYDDLVLVANGQRLREDPGPIRDFIAALEKGTADAERDPGSAADAIVAAGQGLDPDLTLAEVKKTLPRLEPPRGKPFGWMDPAEWARFARYLHAQDQLCPVPPTKDLLTNALLPKR